MIKKPEATICPRHKHEEHEGCKYFVVPETRTDWWLEKINGTVERDKKKMKELENLRWRVKVIWECELKPEKRTSTIENLLVF